VSRELVAATKGSLQKLCERRLDELGRLAVLMIDGKQLYGECVVTALGVDIHGKKHVLGVMQGATENSTVVQHLLDDLVERGLDTTQPMLTVLDGGKALRKAVRKTLGDRSPVQRCHIHKRRNVKELLPQEYQRSVDQRIKAAYQPVAKVRTATRQLHFQLRQGRQFTPRLTFTTDCYGMKDFNQAKGQLEKTVEWLEGINPSAAASLREGLEETLTLHRMGLPEALRKSFQTTNLIESALSVASEVASRVKRWRPGDLRLRWIAAGLLAAEKQFRCVRGHKLMPKLLAALDAGTNTIAEGSKAA
jgi:transposase-like protein